LPTPKLEDKGTAYLFTWAEYKLSCQVSGIREHTDGRITCVVKFTTSDPEYNEYLYEQGPFNLLGASQTKTNLKNALLKVYKVKVDWDEVIGQICGITLDRMRSGEPVQEVWTDDAVYPLEYKLYPILPEGEPAICFAEGGSGKSSMGLFIAICIALPWADNPLGFKPKFGKPLYLDWETNKATFTRRLASIRRGHQLPEFGIAYRRCHMPLEDDINAIHAIVKENAYDTLIIDSVIGAAKGNVNDAEVAQNFYRALRKLNVTSFIIHHTSKETMSRSKSPFGSAYWFNLARSVWELTKSDDAGNSQIKIMLSHVKSNDDTKHLPIGIRVEFEKENGTTRFSRFDPDKTAEFDSKLPVSKRITNLLRGGPLTIKQICDETGIPYNQVKGRLNDLKGSVVTKLNDNTWGLVHFEI